MIGADQPGESFFSVIIHSQSWKRALVGGALAGMAVGVLNLAAVANEWPLTGWFEFLDAPINSLIDSARENIDFFANLGPEASMFYTLLVGIGYWTIIGLLLAPVCCLIRAGVIKRIRRDRTCRRVLMFAGGGGILM